MTCNYCRVLALQKKRVGFGGDEDRCGQNNRCAEVLYQKPVLELVAIEHKYIPSFFGDNMKRLCDGQGVEKSEQRRMSGVGPLGLLASLACQEVQKPDVGHHQKVYTTPWQ